MKNWLVAVLCGTILFSATAQATIIARPFNANGQFTNISGFKIELATIGSAGSVTFKLYNNSDFACTLTHVYFDDRLSLLASSTSATIDSSNSGLVKFVLDASPNQLPNGGKLLKPFVTSNPTAKFSADSVNGTQIKGAKKGSWVSFKYNLNSGKTLADVDLALTNANLRVGVYTQDMPSISTVSAVVPEPATMALLALGSLVFARMKK